jgi:ATP-dependent DNA helicase DinG
VTNFPKIDVWGREGPIDKISKAIGAFYAPRAEQRRIAQLVSEGLRRGSKGKAGILLIEGGTGVGKTLAYLVPGALHVAAIGGRMLVATHTLALMQQIIERDGPIAIEVGAEVAGRRLRVAQLRGRRNFASPSRCRAVADSLKSDGLPAAVFNPYYELAMRAEEALRRAGQLLRAGVNDPDAADIVNSALIEGFEMDTGCEVARDDVRLLHSSPESEQDVYLLGKKLASSAEILVTTHATTAINLVLRSFEEDGEFGGGFQFLVIDEADQWAKAAESASMVQLSLESAQGALRRMIEVGRESFVGTQVNVLASQIPGVLDELLHRAPQKPDVSAPIERGDPVFDVLAQLEQKLHELMDTADADNQKFASATGAVSETARDIGRLLRLVQSNQEFWEPRWVTSRVLAKPSLVVKGRAPGRILKRVWRGDGGAPHAQTTLLTSATLATPGFGESSGWQSIATAVGISGDNSDLIHVDLCAVVHPEAFGTLRVRFADPCAPIPSPGADGTLSPEFISYCTSVIAEARSAGGRCLVLVPAYSDVEQLAPVFPEVLLHRQGSPLKQFLDAYRTTENACLVTPAGWVGLDLPGLVQQLVIPRLPFPPRVDETGELFTGALATMLMKLSQGIGRAIRRPDDFATLWFADPRMPPPGILLDRTLMAPHSLANGIYLAAIPERFRTRFNIDDDSAAFVRAPLPATGIKRRNRGRRR